VVPLAELDATVRDIADRIAAKSPRVLAIGKEAFGRQIEMGLEQAYAYTADVMIENMMLHDAAEGIDAFLQKRQPCWGE
jgi:enoyl-CoA hydratase/carnithine racemase